MNQKKILAIVGAIFFSTLSSSTSCFAATKYSVSGTVSGSVKPSLAMLISKSGIKRASISKSKFAFTSLSGNDLKNSRLYFFKDGSPVGPAVFKEASSSKFLTLSGSAAKGQKDLKLTLLSKTGYFLSKAKVDDAWISKSKTKNSAFTGASLGYAGSSGTKAKSLRASSTIDTNADSDNDGVPDILDIDDDNDGITDDRDSGGGSMISTMYLNFSSTVNAHLNNLTESSISNLLSGQGVFGLTFFIHLNDSFASATGGHVVCDPTQVICRSSAQGGTTSFYTGVSESDPAVQNHRWSDFNADGSGKPNLEVVSFGGGEKSLVAAIQPRTAAFRAGDIITANVTNGSSLIGTRVFTILPPVISSPALVSYDVGSGTTNVDYSNSSSPGSSGGNPIVLTGNSLTFNFFPPQRRPISGVETDGDFRDIGNSRLGVVLGGTGISQEFTCAGYYSELSTGLSEQSSSSAMPLGNIYSQMGANSWPITDATPDTASASGTMKSFKVDLAHCLNRAGVAPGTYMATLMYAGADTNFGAPRSGENIFVTISAPN